MFDIVIVGAGVAGMTAAIYARRAGKRVLVLEAGAYGGQIISTLRIENWPGDFGVSGPDLTKKIFEQMKSLGAEVKYEAVEKIDKRGERDFVIETDGGKYGARAVILAVGTEDRKLGLAREEELVGRGISYCATCDGALYKGREVAVVGGGNTALYDALYLADVAARVYLVYRRSQFRGDEALVEKLKNKDNVEFVLGLVPAEILGEEKVMGLKLVPSGLTEEVKEPCDLVVDGVFVAIGKKPATGSFAELVDLDERGYVVADETGVTSCPGVLVAGDCRTKAVRQLVTAAADGAVAANQAVKYLGDML